ncbi:cation:proton antiporter [Jidongwangia harbinensis]|uniref:cation:proton antiporter n=1 Tax=Jidongwangia harbinensis TaxID=2878561 RepID=UPI001CD9701F|nr:cation:proton antiporter [Jidongwangia harbinensis]MCA2218766.1 cation:proton antiporter [Jidongwangia harbinensis]
MPAPLPPLPSHQLLLFLLQVGLLLATATVLGRLASRLGMPSVVGELLTGVLLGPSLLGTVAPDFWAWLFPSLPAQAFMLDAVGQVGVLLLVGVTGMHLDRAVMRQRGLTAVTVSAGGLLVPLVLGVATGYLLPETFQGANADRTVLAAFFGVALAVSAIPVIAKTLSDMGLLHRDIGQLIVTAAVVDDAGAWFLLSLISALATTGLTLGAAGLSLASLAGFVAVAAVLGRPLVTALMRIAERSTVPGTSAATAVVIIFGAAAGSHALHLEPVFGAFLAGILIGTVDQPPHEPAGLPVPPAEGRRSPLAPLRTTVLAVFAPLFLATAGLRVDLTELTKPAVFFAAVGVLAVAVIGKFAGAYLGARLGRLGHWEGVALGAGLNARGVVEIIVASIGLRVGIFSTAAYTIVVLVAVATSIMAPPILRLAVSHLESTPEEFRRLQAQGAR